MKYIKQLMLSALVLGSFSSCKDDDSDYAFKTKSLVSIESVSTTSITEGESVTVTLTTDTPYKETLDFKLEMISGGDNTDYTVGDDPSDPSAPTSLDDGLGSEGYLIQVPAYASSYTFQINAVLDLDIEGTEEYTFKLSSTRNGNGLMTGGDIIKIDVDNYTDDNMGLRLSWDKNETITYLKQNIIEATDNDTGETFTYTDDDEILSATASLCSSVDFDVFLDAAPVFAFTGDCPEYVVTGRNETNVRNTTVLADGTYGVYVDMWSFDLGFDDDESLIGSFAIPIEVEIAKTGQFKTSISYRDLYFSYDDVSGILQDGAGEKLVAVVEVIGGLYTVYDKDGNLVAQE
ncbi:hypothetical protein ACW5R3_04480 [Bizionia sp. KMM 8389]